MDLQKMVGPLPLWGWIAVIIAGVGIAWVWGQRDTSSQPTETVPGGEGPGSPGFIPSEEPEQDIGGDPQTNEEWGREASQELIRRGYEPSVVDKAIRKYLAAEELTGEQRAMINAALRVVGSPPVPLPPSPESQEPPDNEPPDSEEPPDNGSPNSIVVAVQPWPAQHSTLWGIAKTYYGDGTKWSRIYNANRNKIDNPDLIYPNQRFVVPNPTQNT